MAVLHLEVKYVKRQRRFYPVEYYSKCPNPQYNSVCMGLYVKTRRKQNECTACLKLHGKIDKHPLLAIVTKRVKWEEFDTM